MKIIQDKIALAELKEMSRHMFGSMVKAVVDLEKGIMVIDAPLHADEEALLLEQGSKNEHLWGINLYPELTGEDFIEYDSMINLRPAQHNLTRNVDDQAIRAKIAVLVSRLVIK